MPAPEPIVADVLSAVIDDAIIGIIQESNIVQIAVDRYVLSQSALSEAGLREAILGGASTAVSSELTAFQRYILRTITGAVNDAWGRGTATYQATQKPLDTVYTWRVESMKPCPDCAARNGERRTLAEWQAFGLPRSGFSICNRNCKCVLDSTGTGNFNRPNSKGE